MAWGAVVLAGSLWGNPERVLGQQVPQPAPTVEWEKVHRVTEIPVGRLWTRTGVNVPPSYTATPVYSSATWPVELASTAWFNDLVEVYDNGDPETGTLIGYAAAGYAFLPNYEYRDPCYSADNVEQPLGFTPNTLGPYPQNFETFERRTGAYVQVCVVALLNLQGEETWFHVYHHIGSFYGIIQDRQGNLVVTGETQDSRPMTQFDENNAPHMSPWADKPLLLNPTTGSTAVVGDEPCGTWKAQLVVDKIDLTGDLLWSHVFTVLDNDPPETDVRSVRSFGQSLVETNIGGQMGYRIAGYAGILFADEIPFPDQDVFARPFVVDIDGDGLLSAGHWKKLFLLTGEASTEGGAYAFYIARSPDPAEEKYIIAGSRVDAENQSGASSAMLMYFEGSDPQNPVWVKDTYGNAADFPGTDQGLNQNSNRAIFDQTGDNIIWPILSDFYGGISADTDHEATGKVYRFGTDGTPSWDQPADLGTMRGYDLQLAAVALEDGNIAISGTKRRAPYTLNDPFVWADMDQEVKNCLVGPDDDPAVADGTFDYDPDGAGPLQGYDFEDDYDESENVGQWMSDSYVAKLNANDGALLWQHEWHESTELTDCLTGNFRKRQCMFMIVEDPDGSLVVCGNTGHNLDAGYIAKLSPCDPRATYAAYMLEPDGEYHISANTTWSTSMNVKGSFVIDPGFTLTIDGATIGFADSRQFTFPTNVKVMPGATLLVRNNAELTSVSGCSTSMWDGVKVLSDGTGTGAGTVIVESGGKVSNAFTGVLASDGDPVNPSVSDLGGGGNITLTDAVFENNRVDVFRAPHTFEVGAMQTYTRCTFRTNSALNYSTLNPKAHVIAQDAGPMTLWGCTFENTDQNDPGNALTWGMGFFAFHTTAVIERDPASLTVPAFTGLYLAVRHHTWTAGRMIKLDEGVFNGCGLSIYLTGSSNSVITRNIVNVPDHPVTGPQYNYGSSLYACTGFEFEENVFTATGSDWPKAGSIFSKTGIENNMFYNNRYNGFTGNGTAGYSAGTVIQKENMGADEFGGLHFKCNDYSNTTANDYDIAFTDDATIGQQQGGDADNKAPGGNTFEPLCLGGSSEQNLYVEFGLNQFDYYHHDIGSTSQRVRPDCASPAIDQASQYMPTIYVYDKPVVCPVDLSGGMVATTDVGSVTAAQAEFTLLRDVYDNWADGGNTDGLLDYIRDAHNTSYDVRNKLMLVAPRVTYKAWVETIQRVPAMNPWHVAQALIANSPLQAEVLALVEASGLTDYHKTLINNAQGGGISMLSLMESDMAGAYGRKAKALRDYTSKALLGREGATLSGALQLHTDHPKRTSGIDRLGLALAMGDLHQARTEVNAGLDDRDLEDYFIVQDLYLNLLEHFQKATDLDASGVATLHQLAGTDGSGAGAARAWLEFLGEEWPEDVVLPRPVRSAQAEETTATPILEPLLTAYPNPSNGPIYLVARLPEGAEHAAIKAVDPLGRTVLDQQFMGSVGLFEITDRELAVGVYTAGLFVDGIAAGSVKFEIVR